MPYESVKGVYKSGTDAKQLTEKRPWSEDAELSEVDCYAFTAFEGRATEKKGERRDDVRWKVSPGMALRASMWAEPVRNALPEKWKTELVASGCTMIKAFTLLEVEIACKVFFTFCSTSLLLKQRHSLLWMSRLRARYFSHLAAHHCSSNKGIHSPGCRDCVQGIFHISRTSLLLKQRHSLSWRLRLRLTVHSTSQHLKQMLTLDLHTHTQGWNKKEIGDEGITDEKDLCPVKRGYGMSVVEIRPIEGASLYSALAKLPKVLPETLKENQQRQLALQARYKWIENVIQTSSLPFFIKAVGPESVVDLDTATLDAEENPTQIKISNWVPEGMSAENTPIDITVTDAIRATNANSVEEACCLLEVAAAAGALSLVVCYNQYRPGREHVKSAYSAYPLVDSKVLLKGVAVPVDSSMLQVFLSSRFVTGCCRSLFEQQICD